MIDGCVRVGSAIRPDSAEDHVFVGVGCLGTQSAWWSREGGQEGGPLWCLCAIMMEPAGGRERSTRRRTSREVAVRQAKRQRYAHACCSATSPFPRRRYSSHVPTGSLVHWSTTRGGGGQGTCEDSADPTLAGTWAFGAAQTATMLIRGGFL